MATRAATKKAGVPKAAAPKKRTNGGVTAPTEPSNGKGTEEARAALNGNGLPKLGKGGLGSLVADYLVANPKAEVTPTELSNKLKRSSGAVANALERLVKAGKAVRTSDRPRRYRHKAARTTKQAAKKA